MAYRSSKVSSGPDCIFEIHHLWQSGFSRVYSNYYCSCSFKFEIIKIGQSSYNIYINNIVNFQVSTPISNACTKKAGNLLNDLSRLLVNKNNVAIFIWHLKLLLSWLLLILFEIFPSHLSSFIALLVIYFHYLIFLCFFVRRFSVDPSNVRLMHYTDIRRLFNFLKISQQNK